MPLVLEIEHLLGVAFAAIGPARDVAYVGHSASLTRCRFSGAHKPRRPLAAARRASIPAG